MSTERGEAPAKIQVSGFNYSRCDELAAIPIAGDAIAPADARLVLEQEGIAVVPMTAAVQAVEGLGPVYQLEAGGNPAVPTGRVFVRLQEGRPASERRRDFVQAGYVVESIPAWAPHTAWLRPATGGIVAALHGLERLRALAGVEHVEPQLLRQRTTR